MEHVFSHLVENVKGEKLYNINSILDFFEKNEKSY